MEVPAAVSRQEQSAPESYTRIGKTGRTTSTSLLCIHDLPDCQEIKAFLDSHAELLDDGKHWAAVDDEDLSAQATERNSACDRSMFA